ncbi:coiled-coil domain-containing protein 148-like isoform X2 [Denticeps clupeoides]|uniref:coiled-coil domain-containing protein 148-like isoform X2 n=1 Tax=Denticeps clupeoides TaxID=299321 RepID=UPI0010A4EFBE|nr:coiled-coil domain-containing protein 148 isoform X2 [Denticeps clupeoides]
MSGRDLRAFVTSHRADDFEKLTMGFKVGLGRANCKPVQYEKLLATVEAKRSSSKNIEQKVRFVKDQQEAIETKLQSERCPLEQELMEAEESFAVGDDSLADLQEVPEEISSARCPYPELGSSILQAFHTLSGKYKSRWHRLQERLKGLDRYCGWPAEKHLRFQLTVGQYSPELRNRARLCTDMLQRVFPDTPQQQLSAHRRTWDWYRFAVSQRKALVQSWRRDRADLLAKALLMLEEARMEHQRQLATEDRHRDQQHVCARLREKLEQWHAQQEEVAQLEAAMAMRRQEEEKERLKKEQERELARRTHQKEQVKQYNEGKQRQREEEERRDELRLSELRRAMAVQAGRDKQRVQFREERLLQRREEREARLQEKLKEEEEREERLEALCNQVAVVAEADPERMMGATKAWRGHHHPEEEEEFVLQRPLYPLHTYTETQIVSDPRVRIEQALREAGLHNTLYAKEVLSRVPPPRPPRRDTESTAFRS